MPPDTPDVALAINRLGCERHVRGDLVGAIACYQQAIAIVERTGDTQVLIMALANLGEAQCQSGNGPAATVALERAQTLMVTEPATDLRLVGAILGHLGWAADLQGDPETAEDLLLRGLRVIRQHGDSPAQEREMLPILAAVLERRGDHATADQIRQQIAKD